MRCSHRNAKLSTSVARSNGTTPVILALVVGITVGYRMHWLDHVGLVALQNMDASRLVVTVKAAI